MKTIDIDDIIGWDLQLKIGGKIFKTNPPIIADIARLEQARESGDKKKIRELCGEFLLGDPEQINKLRDDQFFVAVRTIIEYAKGVAVKNPTAIAVEISTAVAKALETTDGNCIQ